MATVDMAEGELILARHELRLLRSALDRRSGELLQTRRQLNDTRAALAEARAELERAQAEVRELHGLLAAGESLRADLRRQLLRTRLELRDCHQVCERWMAGPDVRRGRQLARMDREQLMLHVELAQRQARAARDRCLAAADALAGLLPRPFVPHDALELVRAYLAGERRYPWDGRSGRGEA